MIREDLSGEGTSEQGPQPGKEEAMHISRGRAFLAEGRWFQSPEEKTAGHIQGEAKRQMGLE